MASLTSHHNINNEDGVICKVHWQAKFRGIRLIIAYVKPFPKIDSTQPPPPCHISLNSGGFKLAWQVAGPQSSMEADKKVEADTG